MEVRSTQSARSGCARSRSFWFVPTLFIFTAGLLLADPWRETVPVPPRADAPAWATDTTPVRRPALVPETVIAGMTYRCRECHDLFPSPKETDRPLTQHQHIKLEHGINARCFNCHNRENRDTFVDDRGDPIPFDQPPLLCAKCHGPVYRDWTHDVHGRTDGYWNAAIGPRKRRKCVECHDPHAPAFQAMQPAPAPNTLRMGDQKHWPSGEENTKNPLLIYRQGASDRKVRHESSE
jgi:hypothetical protein